MVDDQDQRNLEAVKLRITFLQHITTLSGAATLIVLALVQRPETVELAGLLLISVPFFATAVLVSIYVILNLIDLTERAELVRSFAGKSMTRLASALFGAGVFEVMIVAFRLPLIPLFIISICFWLAMLPLYFFVLRKW